MNIKSTLYLLLFFFAVNPLFGQITGTDYTLVTGVSNVFDGTEATSVTSSGNFGTVPTIYTRDVSADDFFLDATSYTSASGNVADFGVIWRYSGGNYYALTVINNGADYTYRIKKNSTVSNSATGDLGSYTGTGVIRLEVVGSSMKLFVGGIERISVTDSDYSTGSIGFGQSKTSAAASWTLTAPVFSFPPTIANTTALISDCSGVDIDFSSEVTDEGSSVVTATGFLYSQTEVDVDNATIDIPGSATQQAVGSGTGSFSYSATSLASGTWYYKSYARNSDGDTYSETQSIGACASPTVTTSSVLLSLFCEGAEAELNLTSNGGLAISSKGILFGTSSADVTGSTPSALSGSTLRSNSPGSSSITGTYSASLSGLISNITYYFKAFAINSNGTSYGTVQSFTTPGLCSSYGSYLGNGETDRDLIGLGYDADFLIIRPANTSNAVIASSTMPAGKVKLGEGSTALQTGYLELITDGFTVSDNAAVNADGVIYHFLAFEQGSELTVGSYTGNGGVNNVTGVGFQPSVVFLMGDHGTFGEPGGTGDFFAMDMATRTGQGVRSSGDERRIVSSYTADGYVVGDQANLTGQTYHYAAFGETVNQKEDTYTGDGVDGREVVVDTDFSPDIVFISRSSTTPWFFKTPSMAGDNSYGFGTSGASTTSILGLTTDGFTLGVNGDVNNNTSSHSYFAMKGIQSVVLPVDLVSFKARLSEYVSYISWETASEVNSSHFFVQKSADGINFENIGRVEAAGNSGLLLTYAFDDLNPFPGNNYYRLHQVDIDGTNEYSDVILVKNGEKESILTTFPNPSNNQLNVNLISYLDENIVLQVYDSKGSLILTSKHEVTEGINTISLNTSGLSAGVYSLRSVYPSQVSNTVRFVVGK